MASTVEDDDRDVLGRLFLVARQVAEQEGLEKGYRLIVNSGEHAHMEVPHLHVHLLGGEPLGPLLCRCPATCLPGRFSARINKFASGAFGTGSTGGAGGDDHAWQEYVQSPAARRGIRRPASARVRPRSGAASV